jgi:hypothetical protein
MHVPYHHVQHAQIAIAHGREWNPTAILLTGDMMDFYSISRFERRPDRRNTLAELVAGRQTLAHLRAKFPKAAIYYMDGNHEERWSALLYQHPELDGIAELSLSSIMHFEKHGVTHVTGRRPVMIGKLPVLHGHELPKGLTNPVNPARGAYLRASHSLIIGHHHRTSDQTEPDMFGKIVACWSMGCLCELKPAYMPINKWNAGFARVATSSDGYDVFNHRIVQGIVR